MMNLKTITTLCLVSIFSILPINSMTVDSNFKQDALTTSRATNGLTPLQLNEKLSQKSVLLIDVREWPEHKTERLAGSFLLPLANVTVENLPSVSQTLVFYCRSGLRSQKALEKILQQNPGLNAYYLEGGINAWKEANLTIVSSGNTLSIERQTQLIAGALAFSGIVLGTLVNPIFLGISGFVGLGLMFAGITGWCGMAKLLANMPWNK